MKRFWVGPIEVKVYGARGDRGVACFYDLSGKRVRLDRQTQAVAEKAARDEIARMTSGEVIEHARAEDLLRPFGASVMDAARFYVEHKTKQRRPTIKVPDLIEELLRSKRREVGMRHRRDLEQRLRRGFGVEFAEKMAHEIDAPTINRWLADMGGAGRTRRNYLVAVVQLFRFARSRGYLDEGPTAAEKADRPRAEAPKKEIFTPDEIRRLLAHVGPEEVPAMAFGAFAGIRTEEMAPMDPGDAALEWRDVLWDEGQIYIREDVAKTCSRYTPLLPNLAAWLLPYRKATGRVCALTRLDKTFERAAKAAGVRWRHNGLRHSYGTYRTAITKSVPQVSLEMGNSVQMVKRHYQRPVPPKLAEGWFAIQPRKTKVVPIRAMG